MLYKNGVGVFCGHNLMKKILCVAAAFISVTATASEMTGVSSLEITSAVTPGLKALGVESAKNNAMSGLVSSVSKTGVHHLQYVFEPTIKGMKVVHQLENKCGTGLCLETKLQIEVDDDIIKSIRSRLRESKESFYSPDSSIQNVYDAQLSELDSIQARYSQMPINKSPAESIYSLWIQLTASEEKEQISRKVARMKLEGIFNERVSVPLKQTLVFNRIGDMVNSRYTGYTFSLDYDADALLKEKAVQLEGLVSDTRYVSVTFPMPEISSNPVEYRGRYSCLMFKSPENYLKNRSVLAASLMNQEHEVVIDMGDEVYRIGRGYFYRGSKRKQLKTGREGVPTYCSLMAGELIFEKDGKSYITMPTEVIIDKIVRLYDVDVGFTAPNEGLRDWLKVNRYFDKEWIYGRYRDDIEGIEEGCSTSSCHKGLLSVNQFKSIANGQPHVSFSDVATRVIYPLRFERYLPRKPLTISHMAMQARGYHASGLTLLD